jgi:c-di-GMP-binding flagellar brake protein YcgR
MEIRQWVKENRLVNVSPGLEGENWRISKVVSVGSKSFWIAQTKIPIVESSSPAGRMVRVRVPSPEGLFQFTCELLAESREGRIELGFPKEVIHLERRAFPRLPVKIDTQYAEIRDRSSLTFSKSTVLDVSGGGIRLETSWISPQETLLRVKFNIPLGQLEEKLILTGRIVRSVPGEGTRKNQVGVEFIDITIPQQASLAQYVLDRSGLSIQA